MAERKTAFLFPGQGSQYLGMGRELYETSKEVRSLFKKAEDITNRPIRKTVFEGPKNLLDRTSNTQVAILVVSLGALALYLKKNDRLPDFTAGHSAGEIPAAVAARAISEEQAIALMHERGLAMEEAGEENPGGMAAILRMEDYRVEEAANLNGSYVANYNIPDQQLVISGTHKAVEDTIREVESKNGKAIPLPVTIPAHTPLMKAAEERFSAALNKITVLDPVARMVANRTGQVMTKAAEVKANLPHQLTHSVLWGQSVEFMHRSGVTQYIEFGPRTVLRDMVRRQLKDHKEVEVSNAESELIKPE